MFCVNTTVNKDKINTIVNDADDVAKNNKDIIDVEDYIDSNNSATHSQHNSQYNSDSVLEQNSSNAKIGSKIQK